MQTLLNRAAQCALIPANLTHDFAGRNAELMRRSNCEGPATTALASTRAASRTPAIGPTGGLLGGAIAFGFCGPRTGFLALGLIACSALIFALRLPLTREPLRRSRQRIAWPDSFYDLVLLHGLRARWHLCVRALATCRLRRRERRNHRGGHRHGPALCVRIRTVTDRRRIGPSLWRAPHAHANLAEGARQHKVIRDVIDNRLAS